MKQILITDPSEALTRRILHHEGSREFTIHLARDGPECLAKVKEHKPDLLLVELMLPLMHGIEVLKLLREEAETRSMGVIITSAHSMYQNYQAAIEAGADFFLEKPFSPSYFFTLASLFFQKKLKPKPFSGGRETSSPSTACYVPSAYLVDKYIRFWGTRGSNAVSGSPYIRYGGNTCCLEVRYGKDLVIIDAGTGIRPLGSSLVQEEIETIHLFIGHTHWDHITGFPFFAPLYKEQCTVVIYAPVGFEKNTKELFTDMLAYSYFPVRLTEFESRVIFKELREKKPVRIGSLTVDTHYTYHPGPTFGFKITTPKETIGYVTDNEMLLGFQGHPSEVEQDHPLLEPHASLIHFLKGCDLLIHEAQYFPVEYHEKIGWGHSSISNAAVLIREAEISEWIVTHHDPKHTDEDLQNKVRLHQKILEECKIHTHLLFAFDGLTLPLQA